MPVQYTRATEFTRDWRWNRSVNHVTTTFRFEECDFPRSKPIPAARLNPMFLFYLGFVSIFFSLSFSLVLFHGKSPIDSTKSVDALRIAANRKNSPTVGEIYRTSRGEHKRSELRKVRGKRLLTPRGPISTANDATMVRFETLTIRTLEYVGNASRNYIPKALESAIIVKPFTVIRFLYRES